MKILLNIRIKYKH